MKGVGEVLQKVILDDEGGWGFKQKVISMMKGRGLGQNRNITDLLGNCGDKLIISFPQCESFYTVMQNEIYLVLRGCPLFRLKSNFQSRRGKGGQTRSDF